MRSLHFIVKDNKKVKKRLTKTCCLCIMNFASRVRDAKKFGRDVVRIKEKYSRGRRGAPAKGVGRATGARVQIPLSPFAIRFLRFTDTFLKRKSDSKKNKKVVDKR